MNSRNKIVANAVVAANAFKEGREQFGSFTASVDLYGIGSVKDGTAEYGVGRSIDEEISRREQDLRDLKKARAWLVRHLGR